MTRDKLEVLDEIISGLTKFLTCRKVLETEITDSKGKCKKQYNCPNCNFTINKNICTNTYKPRYCYNCGQLLMFDNNYYCE